MNINKKIIEETEIEIRGKKYKQITYEDGEVVLKQYYPQFKMWAVLRFSQKDDTEALEKLKLITKKAMLNTILLE